MDIVLRYAISPDGLISRLEISERGISEAHEAGKVLKKEGYEFDMAFTSVLKRAIRTLWFVLDEMDLMWIPVYN